MDEGKRAQAKKRLGIYLLIVFALTYVYEIAIIRPMVLSIQPTLAAVGQLLVATVMFLPALSVLLTRLITHEGFRHCWLKMKLRGNLRWCALAWFGPVVLTLLGALVYFALFPQAFDPNMGYLASIAGGETVALMKQMQGQIIVGILLGPILNCLTCFGEEWGWRGYMLPKMLESGMKMPVVLLAGGVIWGLWHAPLTVLGHNYGLGYAGYPFLGIAAMCCFCIVMGTFFSFVTLRCGSCIPAIIAHGALNSLASAATYYTADGGNPFIGPAPTGVIGGSAFLVLAVVLGVVLIRGEKKKKSVTI